MSECARLTAMDTDDRVVIVASSHGVISFEGLRGTVLRSFCADSFMPHSYRVLLDGFDTPSLFVADNVRPLGPLEALAEAAE